MQTFDGNGSGRRADTPWKRSGDGAVILEGEIVGDRVHVNAPEPESFWGKNAARLGRQLLVAAVILASLVILVPLTIAVVLGFLLLALVGRLLAGRAVSTRSWSWPPNRR